MKRLLGLLMILLFGVILIWGCQTPTNTTSKNTGVVNSTFNETDLELDLTGLNSELNWSELDEIDSSLTELESYS